jgi:hypothetical protein
MAVVAGKDVFLPVCDCEAVLPVSAFIQPSQITPAIVFFPPGKVSGALHEGDVE